MDYKPLKDAMVSYFRDAYNSISSIGQRVMDTLNPSSGLENRLAFASVPNPVLNRQLETPDKLQGYFFAEYGVRSYGPKGRVIVITRSDGKQISLERPRNNNFAEEAVRQALANNGISANNKLVGKIAKLLRQKS